MKYLILTFACILTFYGCADGLLVDDDDEIINVYTDDDVDSERGFLEEESFDNSDFLAACSNCCGNKNDGILDESCLANTFDQEGFTCPVNHCGATSRNVSSDSDFALACASCCGNKEDGILDAECLEGTQDENGNSCSPNFCN